MKRAKFQNGLPVAFYDDEIDYPGGIPPGTVQLTHEQWLEFIENPGRRKWQGNRVVEYTPPPPEPVIPDRVGSRQFKMQLEIAGLTGQVEAWVAQQATLVQIAYRESHTFVRDDPMMTQGFQELGFTPQQIEQFFKAASKL